MNIEQEPPNKPNFLLVLILFGVAILVIFIGAIIVLHSDHHLVPRAHSTTALAVHSLVRSA
jgi:hypothetical protein